MRGAIDVARYGFKGPSSVLPHPVNRSHDSIAKLFEQFRGT